MRERKMHSERSKCLARTKDQTKIICVHVSASEDHLFLIIYKRRSGGYMGCKIGGRARRGEIPFLLDDQYPMGV